MYAYPVLCVCTVHDLNANASHLRLCLTCAIGLCLSASKRFLIRILGLGLSIPYPLSYPLLSLSNPLIYPLHEVEPLHWVSPFFSFLSVATNSNVY